MTERETYATRIGTVMTMIGVAVGLGNVWRFPYMVGAFGGAAFVLLYVAIVVLLGMPALMAEWALGRSTRRGPVGAFARARLPGGRQVGWFFFAVAIAATAYYANAIGWVLYYAVGQLAHLLGLPWQDGAVLPPESGFAVDRFARQVVCTSIVVFGCAAVLVHGVRRGIERASRILTPVLFVCLLVLIVRIVLLEGAAEGVRWYIAKLDLSALTPTVVVAALGQACFTLSLGGTFMVVYGSYLRDGERLAPAAAWTAFGDTSAGLLAGPRHPPGGHRSRARSRQRSGTPLLHPARGLRPHAPRRPLRPGLLRRSARRRLPVGDERLRNPDRRAGRQHRPRSPSGRALAGRRRAAAGPAVD